MRQITNRKCVTTNIPRNNNTDDRMDITTMTQQLTASDRLGHTWTFNIPLLAIGLSGGQIVVNNPPTLSWHVKEGREGGKQMLIRKKKKRLAYKITHCDNKISRAAF